MADSFKIAVLGSGPAGLSAAAHAAKRGLSHVLLEKSDHVSDTIFRYQRGKYIMATPNQLVLRSDFSFSAGKREALLDTWDKEVKSLGVNVRYKADAKTLAGTKGNFTITLTNYGPWFASNIVVTNFVPAGMAYVGNSPSIGTTTSFLRSR